MKPISRGSKAGFTLVELIVVIAILAILAGVAIPVYSGYIEKANQAADETLLAAVNTAYGAACLENNTDPRSVSASATLSDGKLTGVAPYNDSFARYFAGNENSRFKHFASLIYNRTDGVFKGYGEGETISYAYSYTDSDGVLHTGTLNVDASQLSAYLGSTYDEMGATALASKIDLLVSRAAGNISGFTALEGFSEFCEENGINATTDAEKANAVVLWMASKVNDDSAASWYSKLQNGTIGASSDIGEATAMYALMAAYCSDPNATISMPGTLSEGSKVSIPNSKGWTEEQALEYAQEKLDEMEKQNGYTYKIRTQVTTRGASYYIDAYAPGESVNASEWLSSNTSSLSGLTGVATMWEQFTSNTGFNEYVDNQAEKDLMAYAAALQMVNTNLNSVDVNAILSQGWQDGGIADLISSITGNP